MPFYDDPGVRRDKSSPFYNKRAADAWEASRRPNFSSLGYLENVIPGTSGFMGGTLPRAVAGTTRPDGRIPAAPAGGSGGSKKSSNKWLREETLKQEKAQQRKTQGYERQSAYDFYADQGKNWGLDSGQISSVLKGLDPMDYKSPTKIVDAIRSTPAWKERFGGVTADRAKNGLNYLNEGEIISKENEFQKLLAPLGLGKGKVGGYISDWVGSGTSPTEIGDRVALAEEWVDGQDKSTLKWMRQNYGVDKKQLVGYLLDNKGDRSVTWFADQQKAAQIGGEAAGYGIDVGKKYANKLVDKDISREEAKDAFEYADQSRGNISKLAGLSGEDKISKRDLANSQLQGVANKESKKTKEKVRRLRSEERARWGGRSSGAGGEQFGQDTKGSGGL